MLWGFGSVSRLIFASSYHVDQASTTPGVLTAQKGFQVLTITRVVFHV